MPSRVLSLIVIVIVSLSATLGYLPPPEQTVVETKLGFQNIRLSTSKSEYSHQVEPTLALDGDNVFVGFKNANSHNTGGLAVSYTYSNDSLSWSAPILMEEFWDTGSGQSDPWMAVFNHTLYYVYLEYPLGEKGQSQITLAKTNDLGIQWDLSRATYGIGFADKETFTIDENGTIYVAYDDVIESSNSSLSHTDQKLSRSFDKGNSFIENVTMSDSFSPGYLGPYIVAAGSGVLYNVFSYVGNTAYDSDIFFDKSIDHGETWGLDTDLNPEYNASSFRVSGTGAPLKSTIPSMSLDQNGTIYVVWADISENIAQENWDVYMRYSSTMGANWSDRILINQNITGNSWMPDLDIDSQGNVYISYYDNSNNYLDWSQLMYRVYYPANGSLSDEVQISTHESRSNFGRLGDYLTIRIDDNDKFHVVWTDGRDDLLNVYYTTNKLPLTEITTETSSTTLTTSSSQVSSSIQPTSSFSPSFKTQMNAKSSFPGTWIFCIITVICIFRKNKTSKKKKSGYL